LAGKCEEETAAAASAAAPGATVYFFCVYFYPDTITATVDDQGTITSVLDDQKTITAAAGVATSNPFSEHRSRCRFWEFS
jgi:hypothetical protein